MRSIKWLTIVVGVSALALVFLGRVAAGSSFSAKDFGRSTGTTYAFRMGPVKSFSSDNSNQTSGVGGSGLATAPRQDILRVGVFTATAGLDSCTTTGIPPVTTCTPSNNGTLTGRTIATTDTNTGSTLAIVFNWSGDFKVNSNGTGVFTINAPSPAPTCYDSTKPVMAATGPGGGPPPPPLLFTAPGPPTVPLGTCPADVEGKESYAFVIVESRERIEFIQTDNDGGGAKIFLQGAAWQQKTHQEED